MLRKLIKYEFRATARVMLPLYLVTIVLALLTRGASLWLELATADMTMGESILGFLAGLVAVASSWPCWPPSLWRWCWRCSGSGRTCSPRGVCDVHPAGVPPQPGVLQAHRLHGVVPGGGGHRRGGLVSLVADVAMFQEMGRMFREVFDNLTAYYLGNGVLFLVEVLILFLLGCAYTCLSFYTPWPSATALPSTRCSCRWPSSSPSRWWCRSSPASPHRGAACPG